MMIRVIAAGAGVLALALVAVAGGWYFLAREDAQLATNAPDIPDELVQATASPSATTASEVTEIPGATDSGEVLTFTINSELSEAAYFVDEELASIGLPTTAKGATSGITGTFYLTSDGTALAAGRTSSFSVDLTSLTSDENRRDQRVQEALETSTYPTATFTVTSVSGYDASIPDGEEQALQLTGVLDLHGVQREVTWEVKAYTEGTVMSALATVRIAFSDFDVTPPTFQGLVSISDQATLQVQVIAEAA
jgi:polyisoprenoid-binding protein YceI